MAKRFTATDKWADPWFCNLPTADKLFWIFILDNCDHAGIWKINWKLVSFHIPEFIYKHEHFSDRIIEINTEKMFVQKFVDYQYGSLNSDNRAHASVIAILEKEGILDKFQGKEAPSKDLPSPCLAHKDKDKDMYLYSSLPLKGDARGKTEYSQEFLSFWSSYPKKVGKGAAWKEWQRERPPIETCIKTLEWQKKSTDWTKEGGKYVVDPERWIKRRRWEDEPTGGISTQPVRMFHG